MPSLPILVIPAPDAPDAPIFPEIVISPVPALWFISRLARAVPPIFPVIITLPVPDRISRSLFPLMVDEKSTLPVPVPDETTRFVPVRVTGELISIKPSLVVMLLARDNAVEFISRDETVVLAPIAPPRTTLPDPDVRVRA